MARLALLSLLALGLVSAFNPMTDDLTYELAQKMLTKMSAIPYIPQDAKDEMTSLAAPENKDELQNLVNLANQYKAGQIDPPKSRTAALAWLQANAPATYDRAMKLYKNFLAKYNTLSAKAQKFYDQLESASYKNVDKDMTKQAINNIKLALAQNDKWQKLDESVKDEFRDRWPEICKFIDGQYYQTMMGYLKRFKPEQLAGVIKSMMAMMQKQFEQMAAANGGAQEGAQPETMQIQIEDN